MTEDSIIIIKKYANRRLYNMESSSYVTLEDLSQMVKEGVEFKVIDAKTEEDLTRTILTQIIVEEEAKGENILPIDFLKKLIGFYGDSMQAILPNYLDMSMKAFQKHQDNLKKDNKDFSKVFNAQTFEKLAQHNLDLFQKTFGIFAQGNWQNEAKQTAEEEPEDEMPEETLKDQVTDLQEQIRILQKQMKNMNGSS